VTHPGTGEGDPNGSPFLFLQSPQTRPTNEPLRRLHPAVARPGRCASRIEFVPFTPEEAARWLEKRGRANGQISTGTLANLFAHAGGEQPEPDRPIGFIR
jgi:hypothetical protein